MSGTMANERSAKMRRGQSTTDMSIRTAKSLPGQRFGRVRILAPLLLVQLMLLAPLARAQQPSVHAQASVPYRVEVGEFLIGIADTRLIGGASAENLEWLRQRNGLRNINRLTPGQTLHLPADRLQLVDEPIRVVDTHGQAELDGATLAPGMTLAPGQSVRTGTGGGIVLQLADGSRIWVRESSEIQLRSSQTAPGLDYSTTEIDVKTGRIQALIRKLQNAARFKVNTPSAVLGVRGTDFRASTDQGDAARLEVLDGAVDAATAARANEALQVNAGFGTVVERDRPPLPPRRLLNAPQVESLPTLQERPVIRFTIPPVAEAGSYRGEIVEPQSARVLITRTSPNGEFNFPGLPDGQYALNVRGIDTQGLEGLDSRHAFTLKARPEPPFQTTPNDRTTLRGDDVTLSWTSIPNATYRVQIATNATFSALRGDVRDVREPALPLPLNPGEYHWRVATIDTTGDQGPFSLPRQFTLKPIPPVPAPAAPDVSADRVKVSWAGDPSQTFLVQLARDPNFEVLVQSLNTRTPEADFGKLEPGRYQIRIQATESDGYVGAFSPPQSFEVPQPPPPWWINLVPLAPLLLLF